MRTKRSSLQILAIMMTAYGSGGGIAEYSRNVLSALSENKDVKRVTYIARYQAHGPKSVPSAVDYHSAAFSGRIGFLSSLFALLMARGRYDYIFCGHLYLVPVAYLVGFLTRTPVIVFIYGIEAWEKKGRALAWFFARRVSAYISCSNYTLDRFKKVSQLPDAVPTFVLPGAVDTDRFFVKEKKLSLVEQLGLQERVVLFTLARLDAEERYKGIDEVIEILPKVISQVSNLTYIIAGSGSDKSRLEQKVKSAGLTPYVVFTGYVKEEDKADYFRLADLFVMPGRGEGFGLVYLEALACGVPVVGSLLDASRETLEEGTLGLLADPDDPEHLLKTILSGLEDSKRQVPPIENYGRERFSDRLGAILDDLRE